MILTYNVNRVKFNEAAEVKKHLSGLPELVDNRKSILTLDCGYPSITLLLWLVNKGHPNRRYKRSNGLLAGKYASARERSF